MKTKSSVLAQLQQVEFNLRLAQSNNDRFEISKLQDEITVLIRQLRESKD